MKTVPVSVVIPTFNRAATIERAIKSIHSQETCIPSEIIVSDDASTDDTVAIAESLGVVVIRSTENRGSGPTRNAAIEASTQPWLAFLDSDDEWLPTHLRTVWAHTESASFVSTSAASVENGSVRRLRGCPTDSPLHLNSPADLLIPENPVVTSSVLVKKNLVDAVGRFRPLRRAQDMDLWIRLLNDNRALVLPDVTVRYHHGDDQASKDVVLMEQNRLRIIASYEGHSWYSRSLLTRATAARRWDSMRASLRRGDRLQAMKDLTWLASHPVTYSVISRMLNNRKGIRARTSRYVSALQSGRQLSVSASR